MNKTELLRARALKFEKALRDAAQIDSGLNRRLDELKPLFLRIRNGEISPPLPFGTYRSKLGYDDERYGLDSPVRNAEAEFASALEDWPSII